MTVEPRAALDRLLAALEAHFRVVASGRSEEDPAFQSAYTTLIDAFETYDEALFDRYGIDTPFVVYDDDDELDDDEFDDDDLEVVEIDEEDFVEGLGGAPELSDQSET